MITEPKQRQYHYQHKWSSGNTPDRRSEGHRFQPGSGHLFFQCHIVKGNSVTYAKMGTKGDMTGMAAR